MKRVNHLPNSTLAMASAAHGLALITPASRGIGFCFAQQLLSRTQLPVVATARKNCDEVRDRLLSSKGMPPDAEKRLKLHRVDVKGNPRSSCSNASHLTITAR